MEREQPCTKVMVIDDEPHNLTTMRCFLSRYYQVTTASDGHDGLESLRRDPCHVVVADERMPRMRGTDVMRWLCANQPDTVRIVLTAYEDPEAMLRSINEGHVWRYMLKPCDPVELHLAITEGLERRRLLTENRQLAQALEARSQETCRPPPAVVPPAHTGSGAEQLLLVAKLATEVRSHLHAMSGACDELSRELTALTRGG